jgi:glyoxylase-like metal-dependent hydrolase (beta-lactamase superfamily II)
LFKQLAISALALATAAACAPLQQNVREQIAPQLALYAMDCGRLMLTDLDAFADDGSFQGVSRELVDPCYLIRHPQGGDLIWDSGLPAQMASEPDVTMNASLVDQLAQLELTPADIEYISFSHSHFDHLGNAALFNAATWIVDADERAYMFRPEARTEDTFAVYSPLEAFNTQLIEGEGDYDVFGDGSAVIIQAPGHTPGHAILRLTLANAGVVLLTGDMWHLAESRELRTVPRFNTDRAQTLASMDKIEALAAETGARVIRQHVPEDFAALPAFPEALN